MKGKIVPLTDERFFAMLREHERKHRIPLRLQSIEKWVAEIQARPDDIRNRPDVRRNGHGGTFVASTTDLVKILEYVASVRRTFEAGDFELARVNLASLDGRVDEVNARVTAPIFETGKKVRSLQSERRCRSAANRKRKKAKEVAECQTFAATIMKKHPDWKRTRVAAQIITDKGSTAAVDTIARRISPLFPQK